MTEEQKELVYTIQLSIIKAIANMDTEKIWELIKKVMESKGEEVAEEKEGEAQDLEYSKLDWKHEANQCLECASEHRQLAECVRRGTPLPKGHGRLIDADALEKSLENSCKDTYETKMFVDFMSYVDDAPTIIEGSESE